MAPPTAPSADGLVVLITGCSAGGLGAAFCRAFAARGCRVWATARSVKSMEGLSTVAGRLPLDVTSEDSIKACVAAVLKAEGRIDVVVNNAGMLVKGFLLDTPLSAARAVMETNFFGVLALNQAVLPHMIARRSGLIINISSVGGFCAAPLGALYSSTKFALRAYNDGLRLEVAPFGVRVMLVAPGYVKTHIISKGAAASYAGGAGSPYQRFFPEAVHKALHGDAFSEGPSGRNPTDPDIFAGRMVAAALARCPPRLYVDGWLARPIMFLSRWLPLWLQDWMLATPLGLTIRVPLEAEEAAPATAAAAPAEAAAAQPADTASS